MSTSKIQWPSDWPQDQGWPTPKNKTEAEQNAALGGPRVHFDETAMHARCMTAYFRWAEKRGLTPLQPSRSLSGYGSADVYELRNVQGVLARYRLHAATGRLGRLTSDKKQRTRKGVPPYWHEKIVWVHPNQVVPVHEVRDLAKLRSLVEDMRTRGWCGRPLLAERDMYDDQDDPLDRRNDPHDDDGRYYSGPHETVANDYRCGHPCEVLLAWTGSHRFAAAREAGIKIPVRVIDRATFGVLYDLAEREDLSTRFGLREAGYDDEGRVSLLRKARAKVEAKLMAEELRKNA